MLFVEAWSFLRIFSSGFYLLFLVTSVLAYCYTFSVVSKGVGETYI